jgi:hypothetical protein
LPNCFSKSGKPELRSDEERFEFSVRFAPAVRVEGGIAASNEMRIEMI